MPSDPEAIPERRSKAGGAAGELTGGARGAVPTAGREVQPGDDQARGEQGRGLCGQEVGLQLTLLQSQEDPVCTGFQVKDVGF